MLKFSHTLTNSCMRLFFVSFFGCFSIDILLKFCWCCNKLNGGPEFVMRTVLRKRILFASFVRIIFTGFDAHFCFKIGEKVSLHETLVNRHGSISLYVVYVPKVSSNAGAYILQSSLSCAFGRSVIIIEIIHFFESNCENCASSKF